VRVVLAPNAFRGGPDAFWVADALELGLRDAPEVDDIIAIPLSDGGDGALQVAEMVMGGHRVQTSVEGPLRDSISASYLIAPDGVAFIETAVASGLHLVADQPRQPLIATTRGTGQLIAHALGQGARRLIVTAGGTASVDMGAGALAMLGARFIAADGSAVTPDPWQLTRVHHIDLRALLPTLAGTSMLVLSDVTTPLHDSIERFGHQKGITTDDALVLTQALKRLAAAFGDRGVELLREPLLGAGGGLAAGLHAALGARVIQGSEYFIAATGLIEHIERSDLVITAEGRFDRGSLDGKLPFVVASLAARRGKVAVIIAGEVAVSASELPPGIRCVELGLPPPRPGQAGGSDRLRALANAAKAAVRQGALHAH
jgi:glycerate 2-kinase